MRGSRLFWILWWFDALIAAVFVFFLFWGLADGSVSSFNIALWLAILAGLAGVLAGSRALKARGRAGPALGLVLILGIPGMLGVLFFLAIVILQPRWN
jgi:hypothetical protein